MENTVDKLNKILGPKLEELTKEWAKNLVVTQKILGNMYELPIRKENVTNDGITICSTNADAFILNDCIQFNDLVEMKEHSGIQVLQRIAISYEEAVRMIRNPDQEWPKFQKFLEIAVEELEKKCGYKKGDHAYGEAMFTFRMTSRGAEDYITGLPNDSGYELRIYCDLIRKSNNVE